jgi:2-polyprenyl-6-hydroxyphenyl methylase/3-demethylubiquinone-9 3-methyltransferase
MNRSADLLDRESHFAFGRNWASYAKLVTDAEISEAVAGLRRLAGGDLTGKRFLDIGCGSGLHSLAALRLGAHQVVALDIDPDSVTTSRQMLQAHAAGRDWTVLEKSVLELGADSLGTFDVVYSWGVLHHTGDMHRAVRCAAEAVSPAGLFLFSLYRRTPMCWFWKLEKRWYAGAGPREQALARLLYVALLRAVYPLMNRRSFRSFVAEYRRDRGMDFRHNVHDWLGGWPYESTSPEQVDLMMREVNMHRVQLFPAASTRTGLFGSGCDEYVYARR